MDTLQHNQYEYARRRIRQKKNVFLHFIILIVGSIFIFIVNKVMDVGEPEDWYVWAIMAWTFIFILHCLKVFITDSFMNKNWERQQIDKLVGMQQKKIEKLQAKIDSELKREL
ncbi:MAG TPA: 2TM domain-containing protein [Flavobacterium sp.]